MMRPTHVLIDNKVLYSVVGETESGSRGKELLLARVDGPDAGVPGRVCYYPPDDIKAAYSSGSWHRYFRGQAELDAFLAPQGA